MKKNFIALGKLSLIALIILFASILCQASEQAVTETVQTAPVTSCPFCDEKVIHKQMFAENDLAMSFVDIKPIQDGHILIIPKRHVTYFHDLTDAELLAISEQIQRIYKALQLTKGPLHYILLNKNGKLAGQSVPHAHVHFIPIFVATEDPTHPNKFSGFMDAMHSLNLYFWAFISNYLPRLTDEELALQVQQMKEALAKLDEEEKNKALNHVESLTE